MAAVSLENVSKIYPNGVRALSDLNLNVGDGELVVLVGPSGSGKTTTLRLIAGLEQPTSGNIRIGDRLVNDVPPRDRDVALVFQRHTLYPHLTVLRNLLFCKEIKQSPWRHLARLFRRLVPSKRIDNSWNTDERVAEAVRFLELQDVLDRKPDQLSGGQQQRVALGRAMVRQPAVFLLDEPLSHLDPPLRAGLRRQLHLLHRRLPATMVYVTHDPVEAMILADRVVVLDEGMVLQVDRPLAVYDRPCNRRVAAFFGWPSMNFIHGKLESGSEGLCLITSMGNLRVPFPTAFAWAAFRGKPLTLGIRPQDINVRANEPNKTEQDPSPRCTMMVQRVEALGSATLLILERDGLEVTAQVDGRQTMTEGRTMQVMLDMNRAHLFDRMTGQVLAHGRPEGEGEG